MLDIALLVPFQPRGTSWVDPVVRASHAAPKLVAIRARDRLLESLGFDPESAVPDDPLHQRSLAAVALATSLERAGLSWRVLDPGGASLQDWRARLEALRADRPRLVGISSTFINDGYWLASLCALVRAILPDARIAVGGYFYATDAKQFLALDADVLCIGEGEVRIVDITRAVRDGHGLDAIAGLYLRERGGNLHYTGDVEPLALDELPLPDWSLSTRIEPPLDPDRQRIAYHVETQRGCVFKCEFCTFRTLAAPALGSIDRAVAAIRDAARRRGSMWIVDGTATYPRDRWRLLMERLVAEGGSPMPIAVYARVTDLDDDICALMARAGVRYALIGQESGDQRMLNAMRKGTRVDQVRPAIASLARVGIEPALSFLYGFPGETLESMATTRRLIAGINDGHEAAPLVQRVTVQAFAAQDFAGVQQRGALKVDQHRYGWTHLEVSPARAAEEALLTYLELSRIPHAPTTAFDGIIAVRQLYGDATENDGGAFFRWAKALDRAIGLFVEQELEGKRPPEGELRRLRAQIIASLSPRLRRRGLLSQALHRANNRATWQIMGEWVRERQSGIGVLTRLALGFQVGRDTHLPAHALLAIRTGAYPSIGVIAPPPGLEPNRAAANELVQLGIGWGKRTLPRGTARAS
jgi:anaerobic magnesium-protoporphyrin IX monomethyl ester cyclase